MEPRVDHYLVDRRFSTPTLWRVAEIDTDKDGVCWYYLEDAQSVRSEIGGTTEVWVNRMERVTEDVALGFEDIGRVQAEVPAHLDAQMEDHMVAMIAAEQVVQ